ncbi:MAG TPA: winged helix-turn-helix domain-containing protein [Solirubrobacterales bacterium]|nr:winged helix-turn-helix domain-containing protein [Solirubrobacterales bacterium]
MASSSGEDNIDLRLVRAIGHPLRIEILQVLNEREASPNEMVDLLGSPLGNIAYHTRVLEKCGCVEVVRTEQRRGAVEHYFRAVPRSYIGHQDWRKVPRSVRGAITATSVQTFFERLTAAYEAGTLDDREDTTLNWMSVAVDQEGRAEVTEILADAAARLQRVHERSIERIADSGEEPTSMIVGLAAFESADADSANT